MKQILLIRPPENYSFPHAKPMVYLPVGMLSIAAALRKAGYNFTLIDGIIMAFSQGTDSGDYNRAFTRLEEEIKKYDFDIVGISAQFTFQWPQAIRTAQLCRKINPESVVIVGGAHASVTFEDILKECPFIDIVVRGEGEQVMPLLVEKIRAQMPLEGVPGIALRKNGKIQSSENVFITDLDALPLPDYDAVDMEDYFLLNKKYYTRTAYNFPGWERGVTVITSRGCPFNCVFCSIHLHMGKKWRAHSAEYVTGHIEHLKRKYDVNYFHFEDDNLSFEPRRLGAILDNIVGKNLKIRWDTPNGVRADTFDESLLKKCKQSGCTHLIFGVESGVQRVLNEVIHKGINLKKIEENMALAHKVGVDTRAFFLIGIPGETKKEIRATVRYMLRIMWRFECFGGFGLAVPLYGTPLFELCKKNGYFAAEPNIKNLQNAFISKGIIKTLDFNPFFLAKMRGYEQRWLSLLLFIIFVKKVILHPGLFCYCLKNITPTPRYYVGGTECRQSVTGLWRKKFSEIYHKILLFQHALEYDRTQEG